MVFLWLKICLKCTRCACIYRANRLFGISRYTHTSVRIMCARLSFMQYKMIDTMEEETILPLPCPLELLQEKKNSCQFLSPNLMFHSNRMSPKYSAAPHISQVFMSKGLGGEGGEGRGQFQGVRRRRSVRQALCSCVCHFCTRMAGWVGLVLGSDVILPGFGSVATLTQPTGSFAAVSHPPVTLPPPPHVCVFVCVPRWVASYLLHTHTPPRPSLFSGDMNFGSNELQAVSLPENS